MKQKRSKSQVMELGDKLQTQTSTRDGGNIERTIKTSVKDSDCMAGVCSVIWKPDSLKR